MDTRPGSDAFDAAALTDRGRVRDHNEDAALSRPDLGLFVVADGMGGHAAGDFASEVIVEAAASVGVASSIDDLEARFLERLQRAHLDVVARGEALGATVGATVVALLVHEDDWACVWSGDSRAYRLRDGELRQLSRDHTEVAELVARGAITAEEAETWPRRNVITRAVGVGAEVECDRVGGRVEAGDVFLLCSDGLTEHIRDGRIAAVLSQPAPAEAISYELIEATLDAGATDNVTCVVVRVLSTPADG
ncbi:PP2C family protein-serine/threonine phosphatase [Jannaschia marina]|uniref:PP2C family protein-serine/threonine phosphatase n=1 Tax=Jannaschia marina TaxID=2741674 RepID=UPI001ABB090C|nr:protein phosphatase 2C domain-containing protein [Jannaschia marina]